MGLMKAIYNAKELELYTKGHNEESKIERGRESKIGFENGRELMNYGNLLDTVLPSQSLLFDFR